MSVSGLSSAAIRCHSVGSRDCSVLSRRLETSASRVGPTRPARKSASWHYQCFTAALHCAATSQDPSEQAGSDDGGEMLSKEEDWVVPGGYQDSLSSNTELGRAVRSACDELETLGGMEQETLDRAEELLAKLGYTGKPQPDEGTTAQDEQHP